MLSLMRVNKIVYSCRMKFDLTMYFSPSLSLYTLWGLELADQLIGIYLMR